MKIKRIIIIVSILIISIGFAISYNYVLGKIKNARVYSENINQIKKLTISKINAIPQDKKIKYAVYTGAETVLRNELTGAYIEERFADDYNISKLNDLRRLQNLKYISEKDFKSKTYVYKGNYIIVKCIDEGKLIIRAYLRFDPTINFNSDFWYNGKILTSLKSLHTFDALTGEGISNDKCLYSVLIDEVLINKNE